VLDLARNFCLGGPKYTMHFKYDSSMQPQQWEEGTHYLRTFSTDLSKPHRLAWSWLGVRTPGSPGQLLRPGSCLKLCSENAPLDKSNVREDAPVVDDGDDERHDHSDDHEEHRVVVRSPCSGRRRRGPRDTSASWHRTGATTSRRGSASRGRRRRATCTRRRRPSRAD